MLLSLHADDVIEDACRRTGMDDFGDVRFRDGLEVLLRACREEAALSLFGHFGTRWDIRRFLSNLLRLRHEEKRAPQILQARIQQPIIITGLPRSGTTFLHTLLAADPANVAPRVWQLIHPYPDGAKRGGRDTRRRSVDRQLRMFQFLAPGLRRMHPIRAISPQECSEINAHVFASLRFDTTYSVPSYRSWLDAAGHLDAYRFHRRFLQHLQHQQGGGRWVLKCPDHIFALAAVREIYPDARFVFVHRDPLHVLSSLVRLTEVLRRPFSRHLDRFALARQECERWSKATELMIRAADEEPFAEPIFHIHFRDLIGDPVRAVQRLYEHFRLSLDPGAVAGIRAVVEAEALAARSAKQHLDRYRIDAEAERRRFAPYTARFGIDRKPETGLLADALMQQTQVTPAARGSISAVRQHPLTRGSD
ncbi:MAG: sulfotransferase [Alphaproteobacteria bacterium]